MAIAIDVAELIGLVCECLLYGIFFILFTITTYILVERRRHQTSSIPMVVASLLLISLATAQVAVDILNIFVSFIDKPRPERIKFLADVSQPLFAAKHAIFICQTVVGDMFVSYRCYIVWGRSIWAVMLPVTLSISSAVCGFKAIWNETHMSGESVQAQAQWITALFSLSLAANAVATALLAFRIWRVDRQANRVMKVRAKNLRRALRLVAETGVLNAAYLFAFTMTLVSGSAGIEIAPGIGTPLVGIIFSIVIIQVGLNAEREAHWGQFGNTQSRGPGSSSRHTTHTMAISIDRRTTRFVEDPETGLRLDEMCADRKAVVHVV